MELKTRNTLHLYRSSPEVTPSAAIDAIVLAAARASPASSPRRRREVFLAGAVTAAVVAAFVVRIEMTPLHDSASAAFGREEGHARAWLIDAELQKPTGPGSQEGLP